MFVEERLAKIKEIMLEHKNINISNLCSLLNVSDVTVRKDLEKLQKEGFLIKTHGGAILAEPEVKDVKENINIQNYREKEYVADLAYKTVENGDSIFLGSGATCYLLAKKLKQLKDITVVTNNINALQELIPHVKNVFLIGGEIVYQEGMMSSTSEKVDEYFKGIFVNKAFTSVAGIDLVAGLTVNHAVSSFIYKQIPKMTRNWTLLIDDMKFDKIKLYQVATIDSLACIITNKFNEEYKKVFLDKGIKIIC